MRNDTATAKRRILSKLARSTAMTRFAAVWTSDYCAGLPIHVHSLATVLPSLRSADVQFRNSRWTASAPVPVSTAVVGPQTHRLATCHAVIQRRFTPRRIVSDRESDCTVPEARGCGRSRDAAPG
jgi:hypothetical protein